MLQNSPTPSQPNQTDPVRSNLTQITHKERIATFPLHATRPEPRYNPSPLHPRLLQVTPVGGADISGRRNGRLSSRRACGGRNAGFLPLCFLFGVDDANCHLGGDAMAPAGTGHYFLLRALGACVHTSNERYPTSVMLVVHRVLHITKRKTLSVVTVPIFLHDTRSSTKQPRGTRTPGSLFLRQVVDTNGHGFTYVTLLRCLTRCAFAARALYRHSFIRWVCGVVVQV